MSSLRRGDVFFADFGTKCRPWLVVQNNIGNAHCDRTIVVPLTSKLKKGLATHVVVCYGKIRMSVVQCEEIQRVNVDDSYSAIEHFPAAIMQHVDRCLKIAIGVE